MHFATCITVSVYHSALTYGRKYRVLDSQDESLHPTIKVQGDDGQMRWFPAACFDLTGADIPRLETIRICDDLASASITAIEVQILFSDGQRRWCFFTTPEALRQFGDCMNGTTIRIHYGAPHLIILGQLDASVINQALRYIESQGELLVCTRPLEAPPDEYAE